MENKSEKSTDHLDTKHPEPSENVQMSIETVTPDTESLTAGKPAYVKENSNNEEHTPESKTSAPSAKTTDSSAEQDNNIETVTP